MAFCFWIYYPNWVPFRIHLVTISPCHAHYAVLYYPLRHHKCKTPLVHPIEQLTDKPTVYRICTKSLIRTSYVQYSYTFGVFCFVAFMLQWIVNALSLSEIWIILMSRLSIFKLHLMVTGWGISCEIILTDYVNIGSGNGLMPSWIVMHLYGSLQYSHLSPSDTGHIWFS